MRFFVQSTIWNFANEKVHLEFFFKIGHVFNQSCFIFYCYNKTYQKKIDELNNIMMGSVSHDFRTPLNGLTMTLHSIDRQMVSKEFYDKYVNPCIESCDFLLCLADDMLVYT